MATTDHGAAPDPAAAPDGYVPATTWPYCGTCHEATVGESARASHRVNGFGPAYYGRAVACPACGSVEQGRWIAAVGVPVLPTGRYRMIYTDHGILEDTAFSRFVPDRGRDLRPVVALFWVALAVLATDGGVGAAVDHSVAGALAGLAVLAVAVWRVMREARDILRRRRLVAAWNARPSDAVTDAR